MRYMAFVEPSRPEATAALMPQMPQAPGSRAVFWGGANVYGQPGTVPVKSERPAAMTMDDWGTQVQNSANSPDFITPSQYQSVPSNTWAHVRYASSNELPVPAGNPKNLAGIAMQSRRVGGQGQVAQPQATQNWPDILKGYNPADNGGNAGWKAV